MDIYRNGVGIARVQNTGRYGDSLTASGKYIYKVCEGRDINCSNDVAVEGPRGIKQD